MRAMIGLALGCVLVLTAGCGTHQHVKMATSLDHKQVYSAATFASPLPAPYDQVHVGRVQLAGGGVGGDGRTNYPFPREAFDWVVGEMLRETRGFKAVTVEGQEDSSYNPSGYTSGLHVQMELDSATVSFMDRNSNATWTVVGWISGLFAIPVWWVHDEIYRVTMNGRATITDRESNQVMAEIDLGELSAEDALSFTERSGSVVPYLLTNIIPPTTIACDPAAVVKCLGPVALADAMPRLRDAIEAAAVAPPSGGVQFEIPDTDAVAFDFQSPKEGDPAGDTVDVVFDLVFPKDSSDLGLVKINDDVVIKYDETGTRPARKRQKVDWDKTKFIRGKIVIRVELFTQRDPIIVVIRAP